MCISIETLRSIHQCCAQDRPLTPEMRHWLADSLERYFVRDCGSLNEAFGLIQGHGGIPWWRERAIRERDAALREMAERHFAGLSVYARAKAVATACERYAGTCWPRDRALEEMPRHYRATMKEQLWRAFRADAKIPVSERRLRTLLAD